MGINRRYSGLAAVKRLGLPAAGLVLGLVLAELLARLMGPVVQGGDDLHRCDRTLGWTGHPNMSVVIETDGYRHPVTWNSNGMHDRERSPDKPDGVFRILMLGDSFVEAQQVALPETSRHILEETLNELAPPGRQVEVMAGAIRGWGPAQQLLYFRTIGRAYRPDLVLVLWLPAKDLTNVLPYDRLTGANGTTCYIPYFALCNGRFDPEPWFPAPGFKPAWQSCSGLEKRLSSGLNALYHHSRLYQRLEPLLAGRTGRVDYANPYVPWLPEAAARDPALQYAYRLTRAILEQLAAEAAAVGAATAVVIVPFNVALYSDVEATFQSSIRQTIQAETGLAADTTLPNRTFLALMQQAGLPTLDLHPLFVDYLRAGGEPLYWPADPHWNLNGNRVAAELMARWLVEQGLVPVGPGK